MDGEPGDARSEVTPKSPGDRNLDALRTGMAETRAALTDKLETLQERVQDAAQGAVQSARLSLDIRHQVQQHPWLMFGTAVLVGAVGGCLTSQRRRGTPPTRLAPESVNPHLRSVASPDRMFEPPSALSETWNRLQGVAIDVTVDLARAWLKEALPQIAGCLDEKMNNATPTGARPGPPGTAGLAELR